MATSDTTLKIKLQAVDSASTEIKNVQTSLGSLVKQGFALAGGMAIVNQALSALKTITVDVVKEVAESVRINKQLEISLKNAGVGTDQYRGFVEQLASEVTQYSLASDEAAKQSITFLTTLGIGGEALKKTIKAAADLTAIYGGDLRTNAELLGRAFEGQSRGLRQFGIQIDNTLPPTEQFAQALAEIQKRAGGASEADTQTLFGSLHQATKALNELAKALVQLIPGGEMLKGLFSGLTEVFNRWRVSLGFGTEIEKTTQHIDELYKKFAAASEAGDEVGMKVFGQALDMANEKYKEIAHSLQAAAKAGNDLTKSGQAAANKNFFGKALEDARKFKAELETRIKEFDIQQVEKGEQLRFEKAISDQDLKTVLAMREEAAARYNAIDLEATVLKERKNLSKEEIKANQAMLIAQKSAAMELITAAEKAAVVIRAAKLSATASTVSGFASGDFTGLIGSGASAAAKGFGVAAELAGPIGALASAAVQLVLAAKDLPKKIAQFMSDFVQGLTEGIPALIHYLNTDFIRDLLTKFLPGLLKALAQIGNEMIAGMINAFVTVLKSLPDMLTGIVKGIGSGIIDGFKSIGGAIKDTFKGPTSYVSADPGIPGSGKILDFVRGFSDAISELSITLQQRTRSILYDMLPDWKKTFLTVSTLFAEQANTAAAVAQFRDAAKKGDKDKAAAALQDIQDGLNAQIDQYQALYDQSSAYLDQALDNEKQLYESRVNQQKALIQAAEQAKSQLVSLRDQAADAFKSARNAILGVIQSPQQSVDAARAALGAAGSPEQKSEAAKALASALQNQFGSAQALAAQGAISGEEFARLQKDILGQLDSAQTQTVSDFDRLINAQQSIIDAANRQVASLDAGFAAFTAKIDQQRQELKDNFAKQIQGLDNIYQAIVNGKGTGGFTGSIFNQNVGNIRGVVRG